MVWSERRTRPLLAFYGVPTAFLAIMAVAVPGWALHVLLAVAAVGFATLGLRARRTAVMESYAVTEEEVRVDRPGQPGEAVPLRAISPFGSGATPASCRHTSRLASSNPSACRGW